MKVVKDTMNGQIKIKHILELSKARMIPMVLVSAALGFFLSGAGLSSWFVFLLTCAGLSLVAGGSAALNNYLEKDVDARMERTKHRVLPSGKMDPLFALIYGVTTILLGVFLLVWKVNLLCGFLLLLASFLYVLVYTPMKRWSWWNTFVGAIPGAIPPLVGWAAGAGELGLGAWILFFILFTWQHPHFYAIALMHAEDYRRADLKMLPVVKEDPRVTYCHIVVYTVLLIFVSTLPTSLGMMSPVYFMGAGVLGFYFLVQGVRLWVVKTQTQARSLFRTSLVYLPVLFVLIVIDRGFMP